MEKWSWFPASKLHLSVQTKAFSFFVPDYLLSFNANIIFKKIHLNEMKILVTYKFYYI